MPEWTAVDLKMFNKGLLTNPDGKPKKIKHHPYDYKGFAYELLKKCKLLSQLIASSWLDDEKATTIRKIFTETSTGHDDSELRDLLTGKKPKLWDKQIFTEDEIEIYSFQINWNAFEGSLLEHTQAIAEQKPPYLTVVLPYPPRPALNEFTVTIDKIKEWVNSPIEEDNNGLIKNPFPPYPYIPLTSS